MALNVASGDKHLIFALRNLQFRIGKNEVRRYTGQKNDELMQVRDDLLSAQKAVIEKDSLLQETNTLLLEQILKTSSKFKQNEVIGGDKGLEKDGHEWTTSLNNIKNGKTWCPYCANKASHTIEDAKQVAFSKNGECLSETPCTLDDGKQLAYNRKGACLSEYYINNRSALLWMCDKKHRWFATFDNVKHLNSWCPFCPKYKREKLCHEILTKYLGPPSLIRKPNFLKTSECPTGLELDIYYPEYGFAIEVQGVQHEKYIKFFHNGDPNNFIKQQARDQLKKELCKENQIALRYVWYYEDPHMVIPEHLRKLGLI
ncbi:hypothetical protein C1646_744199 [Rhizophagus diaphanus]|nr:hypothetical protein C1646_744199 [Rhizophagus diaphanus] [Rhizophagus sp. MUCL 43196]